MKNYCLFINILSSCFCYTNILIQTPDLPASYQLTTVMLKNVNIPFIKICLAIFLSLAIFSAKAATFVVDTNNDMDNLAVYTAGDLTNSLRKCIRLANATPGADIINFTIPGAGPFTIALTGSLPAIIEQVAINGLTQPGAAPGTLMIELNGASAFNSIQFDFGSNGSSINGIVVNRSNRGIYMTRVANITVTACYIGTDITGTIAQPCIWNGMELDDADNITIGGNAGLATRNVISGNNEVGIRMQNGSTGNTIIGNYLGVTAGGNTALGNGWNAVFALPGSNNTTVGNGLAGGGNVIGAHARHGLAFEGSTGCIVKGNMIGVGQNGTTVLANAQNGVNFEAGSNNAIIGGTTLAERNIISGNNQSGISFNNSNTGTISGNFIGTDITGLVDLGNNEMGIRLDNLSYSTTITYNLISGNNQSGILIINSISSSIRGNIIGLGIDGATVLSNSTRGIAVENASNNTVIGGTALSDRNLISTNLAVGVYFNNSTNCSVINSYIGTDVTGLLNRGNTAFGIFVDNGSHNVTIGGITIGSGNIVAGNTQHGILIVNSTDAIIKGNIIGLGADASTVIPNLNNGLSIENNSHRPIIGGATVSERNIISSNNESGVLIFNSLAPVVKGNYIGVDGTGLVARGNRLGGLRVLPNCHNPIIGGSTALEGNIFSNNGWSGLYIEGSTGGIIKANIIGLALNKTTAMGNTEQGIIVIANSTNTTIGGVLPVERNFVSCNGQDGIYMSQSGSSFIINNYVGVDGTGILKRANAQNGVNITQSPNMTIGGTTRAARNIISGNGGNGVRLVTNSNDAIIKGNFMGVGADGITNLGNWDNGIYLGDSSNQAIVGGATYAERNVLSGNGVSSVGDGFRSESCARHLVRGNFCGVDSSGTNIIGNAWAGISLNESVYCTVGGPGAFEGNICSGNLNEGVYFRNATHTTFIGNFVGTDRTGSLSIGNEDWGINIRAISLYNTIGGSSANANTIAYNRNIAGDGVGVFVEGSSQYNTITYNKIYCNAGLGIDLIGTANESIVKPSLSTSTANQLTGTGSINGDIIHVYQNNTTGTGCDCEGEVFLGTAIVSGGTWTFTHNLGLSVAATGTITATETTANGSTSEFADCLVPLPVSLISFTANKLNDHASILEWKTGFEKNNDYFIVERSIDGIHFEAIGTVKGGGNSTAVLYYSFVDENPYPGINYYRLKQVDLDTRYEYSIVRNVNFGLKELDFYQDGNGYYIVAGFDKLTTVSYEVYSTEGKMVKEGKFETTKTQTEILLPGLSSSVYYIKISGGDIRLSEKLFVK